MHTVKEAIIVEGKYDQIKLSGFLDAVIVAVNGFTIYKNKETLSGIKMLAKNTGIVILTDSDSAGFRIRSFIKQAVADGIVLNAYVPDIFGKEKRKNQPSKEGLLGVEGISEDIILKALADAGCEIDGEKTDIKSNIKKSDLYILGLSGTSNSAQKRLRLLQSLNLPTKISSNMLVTALNRLMSRKQLEQIVSQLD